MNSVVSKSFPVSNGVLNCDSRKKPRRKRRRNKTKNTNIKKKRLRKLQYQNKVKTNTCRVEFRKNSKVMSNWYWSNYRKAVEWQEKHKIAQWKACALALLEENRYLLQLINQLHPGMHPEASVTKKHINDRFYLKNHKMPNISKKIESVSKTDNDSDDVDDDDDDDDDDEEEENEKSENDDIEFEMSPEMVEFFKQSFKHKMELRQQKEKESLRKAEDKIQELQNSKIKRTTEMKLLYGDGASMITGMETAVQLSFEKFCDTKSPKFWPNIPFRL